MTFYDDPDLLKKVITGGESRRAKTDWRVVTIDYVCMYVCVCEDIFEFENPRCKQKILAVPQLELTE